MKRIAFTSIALASILAMGCSKTEVAAPEDTDIEKVPVRLSAGLSSIGVKSPITDGSVFTASVGGWVSATGAAEYTKAPDWTAVTSEIGGGADHQAITLTPQPYYEPDDAYKTYMRGWYPATDVPADGIVSFENTDGSVDAMLSDAVTGSRKDKNGKNLTFSHMTAQLVFTVVSGEGLEANTAITSIKVLDAELPTGFDLAAGEAVFTPAADGGLTVPGIDGTQIIGPAAAQAGEPVMVRPSDGTTIRLEVTTSTNPDDPFDVTVTVDDDAVNAGTAYTIKLTFIQQEVELTASVTEWKSATGESTII